LNTIQLLVLSLRATVQLSARIISFDLGWWSEFEEEFNVR
jgi:hypothetical protein